MAGSINQANKVIVREEAFSFQPLTRSDLPMLLTWSNDPAVIEWWSPPPSAVDEFETHYAARIDGDEAIFGFVATYDGEPMSYIQWYRIRDHHDHPAFGIVPENSAAIDLFIGETQFRGRGYGPAMIRSFIREVVFANEHIGTCAIDPDVRNEAAIVAYRKAGFRDVGVVADPYHDCDSLILVIEREELIGCGEP